MEALTMRKIKKRGAILYDETTEPRGLSNVLFGSSPFSFSFWRADTSTKSKMTAQRDGALPYGSLVILFAPLRHRQTRTAEVRTNMWGFAKVTHF